MEFLSDPVLLARFQFAMVVIFHFLFVPLSVGLGLIVAIMETKSYRSGDARDAANAQFWIRIFTATFAVGVATGITMEFSFGTNWADYSRFVGDIFGSPLAAEALFAFFLESVFLGVLLFGRNRVSKRLYMVSSWLVWIGSALSALWIIIANSWMQTPAGFEVVSTGSGEKAALTNFLEAAINPSTLQRYAHTVVALLITGAFVCMAVGAFYLLKNREQESGKRFVKVGFVVALVTTVIMLPAAHMQAIVVAKEQPAKLAAMEGQYESGPVELSLIGWVDEDKGQTFAIAIPGGTSFLADFDFSAEYPGLNDFPADERPDAVNAIFQSYHLMVALFGVIVLVLVLGGLVAKGKLAGRKWPLVVLSLAWIAPLAAIQFGWITAELGRQPWIVYGVLKTSDAVSLAVPAAQVVITIVAFFLLYLFIAIAWIRSVAKVIKAGPSAFLAGAEGAGHSARGHAAADASPAKGDE